MPVRAGPYRVVSRQSCRQIAGSGGSWTRQRAGGKSPPSGLRSTVAMALPEYHNYLIHWSQQGDRGGEPPKTVRAVAFNLREGAYTFFGWAPAGHEETLLVVRSIDLHMVERVSEVGDES